MNAEIKEDKLFSIQEELNCLRNASFFLDNATRTFVADNNNIGCYNDEIMDRFTDGMDFIHELMDKEYKKIQERIDKECKGANNEN